MTLFLAEFSEGFIFMARKPKPTSLKLAHGTHRRDRHGDPALEPGVAITDCPQPPDELSGSAREVWLEELPKIIQGGYFTSLDIRAFGRYCRAHEEVERLDTILAEEGEYYTTDKGYVGQHPAVNQRFKWLDIIRRYEGEFWMTPTARSGKQALTTGKSKVTTRNRA